MSQLDEISFRLYFQVGLLNKPKYLTDKERGFQIFRYVTESAFSSKFSVV